MIVLIAFIVICILSSTIKGVSITIGLYSDSSCNIKTGDLTYDMGNCDVETGVCDQVCYDWSHDTIK